MTTQPPDDTASIRAEIDLLERALQIVQAPPAAPAAPAVDPMLSLLVDRALDRLEEQIARAGRVGKPVGNPNHDDRGRFASSGGGGKHAERRRKRRLRRLRERHRAERAELSASEGADRRRLGRQQAREGRGLDRRHAARLDRHAATAAARHARVDAEQTQKARRIDRGERKAHGVAERHERERAEFEASAGGDKSHLHAANERMYEQSRKALRDRGGSEAEHDALEARIAEHKAKFADPHAGLRQAMADRHAGERAKADATLAKAGELRERLAKQTEARHQHVDRAPDRLKRRHAAERSEMEARHREEHDDLAAEHEAERGKIGRRQVREWKRAGGRTKAKGGGAAQGDGDFRHGVRGFADGEAPAASSREGQHLGRDGDGGIPRDRSDLERHLSSRAAAASDVLRRPSPNRTHKASSAESLLRAALRRRGWTRQWNDGTLTEEQRLALVDDIRDDARVWLGHEALQLFKVHGRKPDEQAAAEPTGSGPARRVEPVDRGGSRSDALAGTDDGGLLGSATGLRADRGGLDDAGRDGVRAEPGVEPGSGGPGGSTANAELADLLARSLAADARHAVGRFFRRARQFVHEAVLAGTMALAGTTRLKPEDMAGVDRQAAAQVAFLDNFEREVAGHRTPAEVADPAAPTGPGAMSAAQFVARAEMYAGGVWVGSQNVNRAKVLRQDRIVQEARFHLRPNPELHACAVCLGESEKGWVAPGSLLPVGDSTCLGSFCDCYFAYKNDDGSIYITARGWQ